MMSIVEYRDCNNEDERRDYEEHVYDNVFTCFANTLPVNPKPVEIDGQDVIIPDVWTDGVEILCRTEALADMIANALDAIAGSPESHTGYYDPYEDAKEGQTYNTTGWWYVDFD